MSVVPSCLLDLGVGLLGAGKISCLERPTQGCERTRSRTSLAHLGHGPLRGVLLKGGVDLLGSRQVTGLQCFAELFEQALRLAPLTLTLLS